MNKITHVAIQYEGQTYSLPSPNRHHHVIRSIAVANGVGVDGSEVQGFLDSSGAFLTRKRALKVAFEAGQVIDKSIIRADELFSEDLW